MLKGDGFYVMSGFYANLRPSGGLRFSAKEGDASVLRMLAACRTRPTPERVGILRRWADGRDPRAALDQAFARAESVAIPPNPEQTGFDPGFPKLGSQKVLKVLEKVPENRAWIVRAMENTARRYGRRLPVDPVTAAAGLFSFLCREVSYWEADAFPLEAMATLENRYDWTFATDAWSLREQLRREASAVDRAWRMIRALSDRGPLLVILNEAAPRDYMTCRLPPWAALFNGPAEGCGLPALLYTGLKISSSEHRTPLAGHPEGAALQTAVGLAGALGRRPVVVDFSRRRFPRSFLRICRFAERIGWGIRPVGKVLRSEGDRLPEPKSPRGLPRMSGAPTITLMDPWPVSDPDIAAALRPEARERFGGPPATKPWQDDRVGARVEFEAGADGVYRPVSTPWIVPVLGGWMRADHLCKSRIARFVRVEA